MVRRPVVCFATEVPLAGRHAAAGWHTALKRPGSCGRCNGEMMPAIDCLVYRITVLQMYRDDGLSESDMATLLRAFPNQTLDFFGALR